MHDERDDDTAAGGSGAGQQGWLFDRPPPDAECESMKPPRRLGKGLADMVGLHGGTIVTSADASDGDDADAPGPVLHLLSSEAEGLPGPLVVKSREMAQTAHVEVPTPPVAAAPPDPEPVPEEPDEDEIDPNEDVTGPIQRAVAPPEPIVVARPEPEPEPVAAVADEWFDPPISAYSPASGFRRVGAATETPAPVPAPTPEPVPEPVVRRAAPPPAPEPRPQPQPEPAAVLDDPVIVDDGLFLDDVVVGSFLPEVDLDS
jgi:hypothetical protein